MLVTSGDDHGALVVPRECTLAMRHAMFEASGLAMTIGVDVRVTSPREQSLTSSELVMDIDREGLERTVALDKQVEAAGHRVPDRRDEILSVNVNK